MSDLAIDKTKNTLRSPAYVQFVRTLSCAICRRLKVRQKGRTDPHHAISRGRSDGSDALCVPVCRTHHSTSARTFEVLLREHGLTLDQVIAETQVAFCLAENYDLKPFMDHDDPFAGLLMAAGIAARLDDSKKVSRGTAKSKSKKLSKFRPLSKKTGTPDHPLTS